MMNLWKGFVWIRICGGEQERFLNLCRAKGIILEKLFFTQGELWATVSTKDFFQTFPCTEKSKSTYSYIKKTGNALLFSQTEKKKGVFSWNPFMYQYTDFLLWPYMEYPYRREC